VGGETEDEPPEEADARVGKDFPCDIPLLFIRVWFELHDRAELTTA